MIYDVTIRLASGNMFRCAVDVEHGEAAIGEGRELAAELGFENLWEPADAEASPAYRAGPYLCRARVDATWPVRPGELIPIIAAVPGDDLFFCDQYEIYSARCLTMSTAAAVGVGGGL